MSPKVAQTLARHSDIRLTMQIYTHIDSDEQAAVVNVLPGLEKGVKAEMGKMQVQNNGDKGV